MEIRDKITLAIQQMHESGESLTVRAIRHRLGAGSLATIGDVLKQWRIHHPDQLDTADAEIAVPEAVATMLKDVGIRTWTIAKQQAELEILTIKTEAEADVKMAMETRNEAIAVADDIENQRLEEQQSFQKFINKRESQCASLRKQVKYRDSWIKAMHVRIVNLQQQFTLVEDVRREMEPLQRQCQDQTAHIEKLNLEKENLIQSLENNRQKSTMLNDALDQCHTKESVLEMEMLAMREKHEQLTQHANQLHLQLTQSETRLSEQARHLTILEEERELARKEASSLRSDMQGIWREQTNALQTRLEALEARKYEK